MPARSIKRKFGRAIETVTPLAENIGVEIDDDYTKKKTSDLVDDILNEDNLDGQMVLICWEHNYIPDIVEAFGWKEGPDTWPDETYDRAWILNFDGDDVVSFENIPQHLLPGDSDK